MTPGGWTQGAAEDELLMGYVTVGTISCSSVHWYSEATSGGPAMPWPERGTTLPHPLDRSVNSGRSNVWGRPVDPTRLTSAKPEEHST